jgi:hypothetical protein
MSEATFMIEIDTAPNRDWYTPLFTIRIVSAM